MSGDGGLELPLKVLQSRLGHASIQMTADRYDHLFPRGDDRAELVDQQLKSAEHAAQSLLTATQRRHASEFPNQNNGGKQIIDLQGDRIFAQTNGG